MRPMGDTEIRFVRAFSGYRMMDHNRDEDIGEGLGITYINRTIKTIKGNG
jgi:hypothetical protein